MSSLVIGGAVFIGSVLVKKLISSGKDVVVIDNLSLGRSNYIDTSVVRFYQEDIFLWTLMLRHDQTMEPKG